MLQKTVATTINCTGIGIHSGNEVAMKIYSNEANTGITFIDSKNKATHIRSIWSNVASTAFNTSISRNNIYINTIEHLMCAFFATGIDNAVVELSSNEVPIMDGSAIDFVKLINVHGKRDLEDVRRTLVLAKDINVSIGDSYIKATPSDFLSIFVEIDFPNTAIGKQDYKYNGFSDSLIDSVCYARTFGFIEDLQMLKAQGLGLGASLDNCIGVSRDKGLLSKLRHENEFARHKMLDFIGDLYTSGYIDIKADIIAFKPSHALNHAFVREIFSKRSNYDVI